MTATQPTSATTPLSSLEELRLARAAASGDRAAREEVVQRLMKRVRNLIAHLVSHRAEAEDLAQTAMLELLGSLGNFRAGGTLASWADRIAARTALARFRRKQREAQVLQLHHGSGPPQNTDLQESDPLLRARLTRHFHRLNEERRVVVVMRLMGGCSLEDIASATGTPVNTVKDRLRVGRQELRQSILQDPALSGLASETLS